jgi:choice-of-anchor A domain-containing protein
MLHSSALRVFGLLLLFVPIVTKPAWAGALSFPQVTSDFNAFIFGNMTSSNSDTEGCVAVGGNASFSGYSVGANASAACQSAVAPLVVGGSLNFSNGSVSGASGGKTTIFYGGTLSTSSVGLNGGVATKNGNVIDFSGTQANGNAQSLAYASSPINGTTKLSGSTLTLTGTNGSVDLFFVSGSQLAATNSLDIETPKGATVIVNVDGILDSLQNVGFSGNTDSSEILYNFYQATSLTLSGIGVDGSVVAPLATVDFSNGQINGSLIADNFMGDGQLNESQWSPPDAVPEPGTVSILCAALLAWGTMTLPRARRRTKA